MSARDVADTALHALGLQVDESDCRCERLRDVVQIAIGMFEVLHRPTEAERLRLLLTRAEASADELRGMS